MPDDRDDLDAVLRRAMASLDGEVPAGYFDALPARVLARLDDPAIGEATGAGPTMQAAPAAPAAPTAATAATAAPAVSAADSLASARGRGPRGRRARRFAIAGVGVAIAASAVIYLGARDRGADSSSPLATRSEGARPTSSSALTPAGAPAADRSREGAAANPAMPQGSAASASPDSSGVSSGVSSGRGVAARPTGASGSAAPAPGAGEAMGKGKLAAPVSKRPAAGKRAGKPDAAGAAKLPDVQGELGGGQGAKSLSADDIERGMAAVAGAAQRCYAGTQGQASLRLTVAPSGVVQAVTVTGAFAGTPVAGCVERAVRAARFPPWDGRPQSFGYSYLLSD